MRLTKKEINFLVDFWKGQEPYNYLWDAISYTIKCKGMKKDGSPKSLKTRISIIKRIMAGFRRTLEFRLMRKLGLVKKAFADEMEYDFIECARPSVRG